MMVHRTAIGRNKLSKPTRFLKENNLLTGNILDFGCGRGQDADRLMMDKYDPYYFSEYPTKKYDTIICNYVLNVISSEEQKQVISQIQELLSGIAYITVRRDIKKDIKTKFTTQRVVKLSYPSIFKDSTMEIYKIEKKS